MHIHYTGWRQENNYVPMNFDGRVQHQQQQHQHQQQQQQHQQQLHQHQSQQPFGLTVGNNNSTATSLGDHSLSFDSQHTGPASLRDPFAPAIHPNSNHMTQYEIQVDSERADRPNRYASRCPFLPCFILCTRRVAIILGFLFVFLFVFLEQQRHGSSVEQSSQRHVNFRPSP